MTHNIGEVFAKTETKNLISGTVWTNGEIINRCASGCPGNKSRKTFTLDLFTIPNMVGYDLGEAAGY